MPLLLSPSKWVRARYSIPLDDLETVGNAIARGQSIGNPTVKAKLEDPKLVRLFCARFNGLPEDRKLDVYFPKRNFSREGVNYLLSVLMGGQCDIDAIRQCRLVEVDLTAISHKFKGPRYGVQGVRDLIKVYGRPLIGGIIKPKIGLKPQQIVDICQQMADGGIDFIKEDEILADQEWCNMRARIPLVAKALQNYKAIYAPCITGDGMEILRKARLAKNLGASAIHLNIWCSLGAYRMVREKVDLPLFFQKSGDKVWTTGPFSIDFKVICKLVNLIGCDFAHVGMYGGYMAEPIEELKRRILALWPTIPSFSCGVTPEIIPKLRALFGNDIMISSGAYICGHPNGILRAVQELRKKL